MSRRLIAVLSVAFIMLCSIYFGYEMSVSGAIYSSVEMFLENYLNNTQKIVFNGMLYILPLIYVYFIPFSSPEILIRIKKELLWKISCRSVLLSAAVGAFVLIFQIAVAVMYGLSMSSVSVIYIINIYLKIFIYFLQCHCIFYLFYSIFMSIFISTGMVFGINMVFLIVVLSTGFTGLSENFNSLGITVIYSCLSCFVSYILMAFIISKKELIIRNSARE